MLGTGSLIGPSNIDPTHKFAWTENTGWANWQHDRPDFGDYDCDDDVDLDDYGAFQAALSGPVGEADCAAFDWDDDEDVDLLDWGAFQNAFTGAAR